MDSPVIAPGQIICATNALSEGTSLKFRIRDEAGFHEAFLIRHAGRYHAYRNVCAHMALTLDLDDNDFFTVDNQALICKTHGAIYRPDDGYCISGPCIGESLQTVAVEERPDGIALVSAAPPGEPARP